MGTGREEITPESCDCCGRDAEDCGMLDVGWVSDSHVLAGGAYCRMCAHLLHIARQAERCAWCETPMVELERAESDGWGHFADSFGDLYPCCPACLTKHFGITSGMRLRRTI